MKHPSLPEMIWSLFRTTALYRRMADAAAPVRARINAHIAAVREEQDTFNRKLDAAAARMGVVNVERVMKGLPPEEQVNVWPVRPAPQPVIPPPAPEKPWPGSAREAQLKFNQACEAYAARHGIVALEEALKPPPAPVPVSDPEPPPRPQRHRYRYP